MLLALQPLLEHAIPHAFRSALLSLCSAGAGPVDETASGAGAGGETANGADAGRRITGGDASWAESTAIHEPLSLPSHCDHRRPLLRLDEAPRQQALRVKQDIAGLNRHGQAAPADGSTSASPAGS